MSNNINSLADNVERLVNAANSQIGILNALQESIVTDADQVTVNVTDSDGNSSPMTIPSWRMLSQKANAAVNAVGKIMDGEGVVDVGDGTSRQVRMTTVASVPDRITGIESPTTFSIDANWWFEDLMYPAAQVSIDLKGKIDDRSDRVVALRVILDRNRYESEFANSIRPISTISYADLVALLTEKGISYTEDKEVLDLPLASVSRDGVFTVTDVRFEDGQQWHYLDGMEYRQMEESGDNRFTSNTLKLKAGDSLTLDNYLYSIVEADLSAMRVRLLPTVGYSVPQKGQSLRIYEEPWKEKIVNVKFGNDEIDIVYFKGVNEDFNIIANEWSEPVMFVTNDLVLDSDGTTTFGTFYLRSIVDWGKQMIDSVKDRQISAVSGIVPNAPYLNASDFGVVQINTQVNASLESNEFISLRENIETTKSQLSSLRGIVAQQQTTRAIVTDPEERKALDEKYGENLERLAQLQTNYDTMLSTMQSLLQENNAVEVSPKYHVRGFFGIPDNQRTDAGEQQIIGFEIQYRYIKEDTTGVDLKTYTYTDLSGAEHTGVFTDWNIVRGETLEKAWSAANQRMEWVVGNISDGTQININQIDLPITKGEKLEFRVRSISEAGWPYSPLKSEWSNSVVMEFPSNLMTSTDIKNIVKDINDEATVNTITAQLSSQGLTEHVNDSLANINSVNGTYFKHQAKNIAYDYTDPGTGTVRTISLQEALDKLFAALG